ncbi:hypothetical protein FIBSPDRAFT_881905 [Athelia psychrophila]|uniref:Uncharacterized protein n=1 Tax=Athelia psychrophila TaxID=1759441 RepID=A0A166VWB5_9AGAM|nr:hypothetical protein FIBSPDRAFT_881905 [Fibularhizoctonia sp. CBS 109695]
MSVLGGARLPESWQAPGARFGAEVFTQVILHHTHTLPLQIWWRYMSQEQLEIELIVDNDKRAGFAVAVDNWDKHLGPGGVHIGEGGGGVGVFLPQASEPIWACLLRESQIHSNLHTTVRMITPPLSRVSRSKEQSM